MATGSDNIFERWLEPDGQDIEADELADGADGQGDGAVEPSVERVFYVGLSATNTAHPPSLADEPDEYLCRRVAVPLIMASPPRGTRRTRRKGAE